LNRRRWRTSEGREERHHIIILLVLVLVLVFDDDVSFVIALLTVIIIIIIILSLVSHFLINQFPQEMRGNKGEKIFKNPTHLIATLYATMQQQQTQMQIPKLSQNITLRGSTEIVTEFFGYAVNSILYQRGLYPPSTFEVKKKYGLGMLVSSDEEIKNYLVSVLDQINEWLIEKKLEKLVLVISSVRTRETVERWVFDIETDSEIGLEENEENVKPTEGGKGGEKNKKYEKSKQDITNEIAAIMRQIAASVTFLPLLEDECSFDLIVYTNKDSETPQEWEESDPRFIRNAETVKLRSFSTKVHSVEAAVAYKAESPLNV
jgi:mitotic spindle assembly checkpoint protein MAD2